MTNIKLPTLSPGPVAGLDCFGQVVSFLVKHDMLDARDEYDISDVMAALADNYEPETRASWQPISTAPKDGTDILLSAKSWHGDVVVGCWSFGGWRDRDDADKLEPTHWMAVPEFRRPAPVRQGASLQPDAKHGKAEIETVSNSSIPCDALPDSDEELCKLSEKFGASVAWPLDPEFHYVIEITADLAQNGLALGGAGEPIDLAVDGYQAAESDYGNVVNKILRPTPSSLDSDEHQRELDEVEEDNGEGQTADGNREKCHEPGSGFELVFHNTPPIGSPADHSAAMVNFVKLSPPRSSPVAYPCTEFEQGEDSE
jgi:hypothetical protein